VAEVARLMADSILKIIVNAISIPRDYPAIMRKLFNMKENFKIFFKCFIIVCEGRDFKIIYVNVRKSELTNFTEIDSLCGSLGKPGV